MTYDLTRETAITDLGCLVETYRQVNAHGLQIEHVTLKAPPAAEQYPAAPSQEGAGEATGGAATEANRAR